MPRREIGLMGYIGEAVVQQWLERKYSSHNCKIVSQIIPTDIQKKGGGYLDFGVIKNNQIMAVFEVKSQDFIPGKNFKINKALQYLWANKGKSLEFAVQDAGTYYSDPKMQAFLLTLVGPNKGGIEKIGRNNLCNVILFEELWRDLKDNLDFERISNALRQDSECVISILKTPSKGKKITPEFLKLRGKISSDLI